MSEDILRAIIYIDGLNLYHRALQKRYNWLDVKKLCEQVINKKCRHECRDRLEIVKIKYFTADFKTRSKDTLNKKQIQNKKMQALYHRALKAHISPSVFELHKGRFKEKTLDVRLEEEFKNKYDISENIISYGTWEEKETDVNIAVHILHDAHLGSYDCGILLSNDSDLLGPLNLVKEYFGEKIILGLISPAGSRKNVADSLIRITDFICRIDDENLKTSQLPDPIEIGGTTIRKPDIWR